MQIIIWMISIVLFFIVLLEYTSVMEVYGVADLFIEEQVNITISKGNASQIIPAKIGIDQKLWKDHSLANFSIDPDNISPLNTKGYDGVLYIESIYDREFTLNDFINIWGIDKSKITNVLEDDQPIINYEKLILTDGQNLTFIIEMENLSCKNFTKYNNSKISLGHPPQWKIYNHLELPKNHEYISLSLNETFFNLIELFPKEFEYMTTPYFYVQITKLDSNQTEIDQYYKNNLYKLLQPNIDSFPKFLNYSEIENFDDNRAYKIFLNTTLIADPGHIDVGNNINQISLHIWTIKNGYFYNITFNAYESVFSEYYDTIECVIKSIHIK
jgi:hypothetical protein